MKRALPLFVPSLTGWCARGQPRLVVPRRLRRPGRASSRRATTGHRGDKVQAPLPGAHGYGVLVRQAMAGATEGQRCTVCLASTDRGASDGAPRHAGGRHARGQWAHGPGPDH